MFASHSISIIQQPKIGRQAGVLETSSKRLLDPPLRTTEKGNINHLAKLYTCKVNLHQAKTKINADFIIKEEKKERDYTTSLKNLLWDSISMAKVFYERADGSSNDCQKLYFVFPHLSIRIAGDYYLSCSVINGKK